MTTKIHYQQYPKFSFYTKNILLATFHPKDMKPTESTDETSETMIMMIEVLERKIGMPHCSGYGTRTHGEVLHASETSVRQCFMVYACFTHASIKIFELGMLGLQPLKLQAPPTVRKKAYAHTITILSGTCKFYKGRQNKYNLLNFHSPFHPHFHLYIWFKH